ncbi:MAG: hypothetical protein AAF367_01455 [Pseudomonadota bacterium]
MDLFKENQKIVLEKKPDNCRTSEKIFFIGRDGKSYADAGDLARADAAFKRHAYSFIGRDGRSYTSSAALAAADADWKERNFRPIPKRPYV